MDEFEYGSLQEAFSRKLKNHPIFSNRWEEAYNEGVLACKSILKSFYKRSFSEKRAQAKISDIKPKIYYKGEKDNELS